jgi:alpha-galactosidase
MHRGRDYGKLDGRGGKEDVGGRLAPRQPIVANQSIQEQGVGMRRTAVTVTCSSVVAFAIASAAWGTLRAQDPAALRQADPPASGVWLDSLDLSRAPVRRPRGARGQQTPPPPLVLTLGGEVYPHGIPFQVNADLAIDLKGQAARFLSVVGLDDRPPTNAGANSAPPTARRGSVTFDVWVDGKRVAESGVMRSGDAPKLLTADLAGAHRLILAVGDAGDGTADDNFADWGGAVVVMAQDPAAVRPEVMTLPVEPPPPIASARSAEPRLNSPRITGATPGRPFLFRIPASGEGPLRFTATHLPTGLSLDPATGIITGALAAAGRSVVEVTVTGPRGRTSGAITVVGGPDALALTPPLGWNSWNVWAAQVDDAKVRAAADGMVASGLAAQGYTYINIDDAWEGPRDASGEITSNEKFPDMKALADYVHAQGLKIGIYSSPGPRTCQQRYAGSVGHEAQDARTWATWGFDYIKYDWCSYEGDRNSLEGLQKPYRLMRSILDTLDRDFVFSLCQYGWGNVWEWGDEVGGNLWRVTGDITDTWSSMSGIGFAQNGHEKYAGPGHWNDTDMLVVGKVGWGRQGTPRDTQLTPNEQMTHISLWTLQAAPLIIGADLSQIDAFTTNLLGNPEVLAINQDVLGRPASRFESDGRTEVWARPLADGTMAVGLFNRGPEPTPITARLSDLGLSGVQAVRDLWLQKDLPRVTGQFTVTVPRHGAVLVKIGTPRARSGKR